jgi:hypothetical protein
MDDALLVRGLERAHDLPRHVDRFLERDCVLRDPIGQRRALDELEDQRAYSARPFLPLQPVDLRNVRMVQRREDLSLALESREPVGVVGERRGENFQRDVAVERRIPRAIDLAHAACAEDADDLIDADARAGGNNVAELTTRA